MDTRYLKTLRERAERALAGRPINQAVERFRAIVGPVLRAEHEELAAKALETLANIDQFIGQPELLQERFKEFEALELLVISLRPSVLTANAQPGALPEISRPAFPEWGDFSTRCAPHLYAIGRVDRIGRSDLLTAPEGVGTAFLVRDEKYALTNRHVVEELSFGTGILGPGIAAIRFAFEYGAPDALPPVPIARVLGMSDTIDLALLELEYPADFPADAPGRSIVEFDTAWKPEPGARVAAVGYPQNDSLRNALYIPQIFGNRFGVKRIAPGEAIAEAGDIFFHDCSTLGGNSGSPLLSMPDARAVGVHFAGTFLRRNEAIKAASAETFLDTILE